jgi:hypothetical protein
MKPSNEFHQQDVLQLQGNLRSIPTGQRSLSQIGAEIITHMHQALMKKPGTVPVWVRWAMPYAKALRQCDNTNSMYGAESARGIALYLLNNLTYWKGNDARRIKAEIKQVFEID